jgi:hypothetical protein
MTDPTPRFHAEDSELTHYRAMSGLAVAALLLGIASPLAMLAVPLWIVPWVGVLVGIAALWRIARQAPALAGGKVAWVGLTVAIVFAVAAPSDWIAYRMFVRREARQFVGTWFQLLAQRQPHKAHHLTVSPRFRWALDDKLWSFYRESPRWRLDLEAFGNDRLVRTLAALGPDAHARYCGTLVQDREEQKDIVILLYAVTYPEPPERKTFFVAVRAERQQPDPGRSDWQIAHLDGGVRPDHIPEQ